MLLVRVWVALSIGLLHLGQHAVEGACGAPPVIEHTTNNSTGDPPYTTDTVIKYECNEGYTRNGYKYVRCLENGTWWQHTYPLTCTPKSCGDPGTPDNGEKDSYVYTVSSVVRYSCNEGYELNGPANRQCLVTGKWSRSTPTCDIIQCAVLVSPANGQITLDNSRREYESRASLNCNDGFRAGSTTTRVCQGDKTWSGGDFVCDEIVCGPHPSVPNAVVEAQGYNKWGDSVHVRCFDNATSSTPHLTFNVIHCNDAGLWSPGPQDCWGCCRARADSGDNSVAFLSIDECVPHGERRQALQFSCNRGYSHSNAATECNNGTFSPIVTCSRIRCQIPVISNGHVVNETVGQWVDFDTEIFVDCDPGYQIPGAQSVSCDVQVLYPQCQPRCCSAPKARGNNSVAYLSNAECVPHEESRQAKQFTCSYGYSLSDPVSHRVCSFGTFSPSLSCLPGCPTPKDFAGEMKNADTNGVIGSIAPHNTRVMFICPQKLVIFPSMTSSMETTCVNGTIAKHPSCIPAPCSFSGISEFLSDSVEPDCLLVSGESTFLRHNCSSTLSCSKEGETATLACVQGILRGKPCQQPPAEKNFPTWAIVLLALIGLGLGIGGGLFCCKKKVRKKTKHIPEDATEMVRLKETPKESGEPGEL